MQGKTRKFLHQSTFLCCPATLCLNTVLFSGNLILVFLDPEFVGSRELTHLLCLQSLVELESIWESLESLLLLLQ